MSRRAELYKTFIEGYTWKQWGRDPKMLPASIVKRLPIRMTLDDDYFIDRYQGAHGDQGAHGEGRRPPMSRQSLSAGHGGPRIDEV